MTREEAYRLAMRACDITWNEKTCEQIREALEQKEKTGRWTRVTDKTGYLVWECGCGWQQRFATKFCPDCGIKMQEVEK